MKLRFCDVRDLVKTGYFRLNQNDELCTTGSDRIIDFHTHIGWNYFLAKPVNQQAKSKVQYFFPDAGVPVNLENYSAFDVPPPLVKMTRKETIRTVFSVQGVARTHSAINLLHEMNNLGVEKSIVLAIDYLTEHNSKIVLKSAKDSVSHLVPFISIHPFLPNKEKILKRLIALGAKGIKIHPPMQLVKPSNKHMIELCQLAGEYRIPVLFHCGHSPLSPSWQRRYVHMEDYLQCIKACPKTTIILGHSGITEYEAVAEMGHVYPNVYAETSGQPPKAIHHLIKRMGSNRLLFGSDWPYYPIALPLAKVFIATEKDVKIRNKILFTNALTLLSKLR